MSSIVDPLVELIAARIRRERDRRDWTLDKLAEVSGVSRAMINRIEHRQSSPTAVILGKLSAAFELSVASLLTATEPNQDESSEAERVARGAEAAEWRDPDTGYRRRQITGPRFPIEVAEIRLPAGARVPYPAAAFAFIRQAVWVLEGDLTFHEGETVHELSAGDALELGDPAPCTFVNNSDAECRYAVILTRVLRP